MDGSIWVILSIIAPIFSLILLGRLVLHRHASRDGYLQGLTDLVYWIALPALLFLSVIQQPPVALFNIVIVYFSVALTGFGLALALARLVLFARLSEAAVFALNAIFGNTVLLGIPIVGAIWGKEGLSVLLAIITFHSISMLPLCTLLIEIDQGRRNDPLTFAKGVASGILRNPIIMAIVFAYLWRAIGIPLGGPPLRLLELISQAAPALALVCLGASLPTPKHVSAWREATFAAVIKLVLLPLAMAGAARWAGLPPLSAMIMIVTAALPTGANAFMLARSAGSLMESSAASVVLTTALSVVTLSVVLVLFH